MRARAGGGKPFDTAPAAPAQGERATSRRLLGAPLWLAVVLLGCAHQYGGRATVLAPGKAQVTPAAELDWVSLRGDNDTQSTGAPWLQVGLGYHIGIGNRTELGLRAFGFGIPKVGGQFGVAADSKFQLYRSDDRDWGWDISAGLSPSYHFVMQGDQPFHLFGFTAPLLFGKNLGRHQLILGLRVADFLLTSYGQRPVNTFWGGASLGFALRVRRVELQPEVSLMWSPITFNGESQDQKRNGVAYVTFGLAMPIDVGR
jgi:hypothetical protein